MMEKVTRESLAALAAERWKRQYCDRDYGSGVETWRDISAGDTAVVHACLVELGSAPSADDVDRVIGNQSWTHHSCSEPDCPHRDAYYDGPWIVFDDSEGCTVLCDNCVRTAAELLR